MYMWLKAISLVLNSHFVSVRLSFRMSRATAKAAEAMGKGTKGPRPSSSKATLLPFPVDSRLTEPVPEVKIVRPPGVTTLEEWDALVLMDGKHRGKSFRQAYLLDVTYRKFMGSNPKLKEPWALSYQNYVRAREALERQQISEKTEELLKQKGIFRWPETAEDEGEYWETVEEARQDVLGRTELKRSSDEPVSGMTVEANPEVIQQLQTQITILQRELSRLTGQLG